MGQLMGTGTGVRGAQGNSFALASGSTGQLVPAGKPADRGKGTDMASKLRGPGPTLRQRTLDAKDDQPPAPGTRDPPGRPAEEGEEEIACQKQNQLAASCAVQRVMESSG